MAGIPVSPAQHTRMAAVAEPDDRFIPIQVGDLVAALSTDESMLGPRAGELRELADALQSVLELEANALENQLLEHYAIFNPDRDTRPVGDEADLRTAERYIQLQKEISYLFDKANFEQLSDVQIDAAVRAANKGGIRVRLEPDRVVLLSLWVRGGGSTEKIVRGLRTPIKGRRITLETYRRLGLLVRLTESPYIMLKLFKDIPVVDVQALLPHAQVQMSWWDRLTLIGGGAGTVGTTAAKLLSLPGIFLALGKLVWLLLVGLVMLGYRTFMGYRRARKNCESQRTQHLYFQNLSNNAGVIHTLINMITQEDIKEGILAYAACWAMRDQDTISGDEIARWVRRYLNARFQADVDFDLRDSTRGLRRLGLCDPDRLTVLTPESAVQRLEEHWRCRRSEHYHRMVMA